MYGIFTFDPHSGRKPAFGGHAFAKLEDVKVYVGTMIVEFQIDAENDAADFFATNGQVYSVERLDMTPEAEAQLSTKLANATYMEAPYTMHSERRQMVLSGQLLTMADGSQWFHPNNGDAPTKVRDTWTD